MTTLYATITEINDKLSAASRQHIASKRDKSVAPVDDSVFQALKAKREEHYREVAAQFLTLYFDPSLVQDGEPMLAALCRVIGAEAPWTRTKGGPAMDAVVGFAIGFTEEGDLLLPDDNVSTIACACDAIGFRPGPAPDWEVSAHASGKVLRKKVSHG